jgi:formate hydrogenlyase subunit 6/NADH:ubiquinone oxidoreductase subunit I
MWLYQSNFFLLREIWFGLIITFQNMFKLKVTINYPFEKGPLSTRFRVNMCCVDMSQGKSDV